MPAACLSSTEHSTSTSPDKSTIYPSTEVTAKDLAISTACLALSVTAHKNDHRLELSTPLQSSYTYRTPFTSLLHVGDTLHHCVTCIELPLPPCWCYNDPFTSLLHVGDTLHHCVTCIELPLPPCWCYNDPFTSLLHVGDKMCVCVCV